MVCKSGECSKEFVFLKVFPFAQTMSGTTITCGYFDSLLILRLAERVSHTFQQDNRCFPLNMAKK